MRGRLSFVFFVLLVGAIPAVLSLSFLPKPREIDNTIPFIYYYENIRDALVIERADGTDSRTIAEGIFNGDSSVKMSRTEWSLSGQWLAWHNRTVSEGGETVYTGWLVSMDGKVQQNLNEKYGLHSIYHLEWSPVDETLLVIGSNRWIFARVFVLIVDAATGSIIAQTSVDGDDDSTRNLKGRWLPDGSGVNFDMSQPESHLIGILYTNGQSALSFYPTFYHRMEHFASGRVLHPVPLNPQRYNKWTLVMEDTFTGKRVLFGEAEKYDAKAGYKYQVYWNDDLSRALIQECDNRRCEVSRLFMMDWNAETVTSLGEGTLLWNPPQGYSAEDVPVVWSRDGRYLVYVSTDGHTAVYDAIAQTTRIFNEFDAVRWLWTGTSTAWIHTGKDKPIYRYEAASGQLEAVVEKAAEFDTDLIMSPDMRYLIERHSRQPYQMHDLQTGGILSWTAHNAANPAATGSVDVLEWSSDSRWFFSAAILYFGGGGGRPDAWTIHSVDGTVRRELGICFSCAGFVPERALKHLAEGSPVSVISQPVMTLAHEQDVHGVTWNADGTRLATYSGDYNVPQRLNIWEISAGTLVLLNSFPTDLDCNPHPSPCLLRWSSDGRSVTIDNYRRTEVWDIEAGIPVETAESELYQSNAPKIPVEIGNPGWSGWSKDNKTPFAQDEQSDTLYMLQDNELRTLQPGTYVTFADYRAGSPVILAGNYYRRTMLWDAQTGERLTDLNFFAQDAALSPDGTQIAAAGSQIVTIWNVADVLE